MVNSVFRIPHQPFPAREPTDSRPNRLRGSKPAAPSRPAVRGQFVAGHENALLQLAPQALATPGRYNPVFLHGGTGVGKTHLLEVLTEQYRLAHPEKTVFAVTAADFARATAEAKELDAVGDLQRKHRNADLFVMDDLPDLAGKLHAQVDLLHALDELVRNEKPVLISSRLVLADVDGLLPGLKSRLAGGLCIPIVRPAAAARRAIIGELADELTLALSPEVVDQLVQTNQRFARRLESVAQLKNVLAELSVANENNISVSTVRRLLEQPAAGMRFTARQITTQTAKHFSLKSTEITGPSRRHATVQARGIAIYLARKLTGHSLEEIGKHFGHRDHSTILHSYRKVEKASENNPLIRKSIHDVANRLGAAIFIT